MINPESVSATIELLKQELAPMGEVIKNSSLYGWELMVQKAFWVDGILGTIAGVVFLVLSFICFKYSAKLKEDRDDLCIPFAFGVVLFFGIGIIFLFASVPYIAIPEYYVIRQLLGAVN